MKVTLAEAKKSHPVIRCKDDWSKMDQRTIYLDVDGDAIVNGSAGCALIWVRSGSLLAVFPDGDNPGGYPWRPAPPGFTITITQE